MFRITVIVFISVSIISCALQSSDITKQNQNKSLSLNNQCPSINPTGITELAKSMDECRLAPNCKVVYPGGCYCPPGVECICGGGDPPICVPK